MRDEMDCKSPGLKLLRQKTRTALQAWPHCELFHVRRDWNASADMLAGQARQRQGGRNVHSPEEIQDLKTLNRLGEVIRPRASSPEMASPASLDADNLDAKNLDVKNLDAENGDAGTRGTNDPVGKDMDAGRGKAQVLAVTTRSAAARMTTRRSRPPEVLEELVVQRLRLDRIRAAQDEEVWIVYLKKYLRGDVGDLSRREVKNCQKLAPQYEEGESGLLYYQSRNDDSAEGRDEMMKLVIPETLREDVLHHYHASLEGGHQGIDRTYQRVRRHFHWPGIFRSVQRYVGECTDCETGKGRPTIQGESPGNIVATYPFQVIAMDHIPSLPASYKGNTELLVWVDLFTGFVVVKANASRTAQTVAEAYEEAVFRRFGASEAIRHDREPGFMSDFFKAFSKLMGQRQRATLAYRPQANGAAERMLQTVTRAIKMYIADVDQRDWDEYTERLTFAQNTSHDRTRN
ncbi:hypothetical protein PF003_g7966 [Phytophthora fragariae]|nr:hypothetical protein PF003_g7966 [Phytophthora fragariae]